MNELTLRDWFAGCALQGMIAQRSNVVPSLPDTKDASSPRCGYVATVARRWAAAQNFIESAVVRPARI